MITGAQQVLRAVAASGRLGVTRRATKAQQRVTSENDCAPSTVTPQQRNSLYGCTLIIEAVQDVTKAWRKQRLAEIKDHNAALRRRDAMTRTRRVTMLAIGIIV